jgi:abhydrolase domain-containing protein 8
MYLRARFILCRSDHRSYLVFTPQKPLLYFLHGVGCSADVWSALLQYFTAAGYEVVAPDMLGHGYSAAPDNASAYTFHRLLKDSIDIFDRFVGEDRTCVVVGHAYG